MSLSGLECVDKWAIKHHLNEHFPLSSAVCNSLGSYFFNTNISSSFFLFAVKAFYQQCHYWGSNVNDVKKNQFRLTSRSSVVKLLCITENWELSWCHHCRPMTHQGLSAWQSLCHKGRQKWQHDNFGVVVPLSSSFYKHFNHIITELY